MGKKADKGFSWSLNEDYVSPKGLKNLRKYKYSGVDNCITTMLLNDYWNWLVNSVIPSYVAPNVLTLCGGLCVLVAYSLCAFSNPYISDSTVSPIILVLSALLIFAYQTLDAVDGKQARKTGSSSPLGELFDHGVDAIVMGLICPISACATGAPIHFVVLCTMTSLVSFYATHWEHYFTGVMEFGAFGPCELHYAVILGLLVMACAGKPLSQWTYPLGIPAGTAVNLFFAGIIAVSLFMTYVSISHVLTDDEDNSSNDANSTYVFNNDDNFKYRKRRSSALRGFIPCLLFVFLSCLWALVEYDALVAMPHVFVLTYALVFAYVAQRLIVQRVCSEPLVMVYPIFIPLFLCSVNGALGIISSKAMAYTMLGISVAQEIIFSVSFINQLSGFLHIRPFVVSKVRFDDDDDDDDNESDDE